MKLTYILLSLFAINLSFAQKGSETIKIPKGIVYNYCDNKIVEKTKKLITESLSDSSNYSLMQKELIIGPVLWKRFKDIENIQKIEKGRVEFHVDDLILDGKMCQDVKDSKIIWDELRKEVSENYIIRKANELELQYYWSVISFDIDEPLLIIETKKHNYILNFVKKDLKLMWLDEAPRTDDQKQIKDYVIYENGKEIDSVSKGVRETKLEKILLLNTDEELEKHTSVEEITSIMNKINGIFNELFKNSMKPGKIMVEIELNKKDNKINFAVKDDLDLEIMKEFEIRVNKEKFSNSKKDPIKFQLIYKVNSFNDTE